MTDTLDRIEELSLLGEGWCDGEGKPINPTSLRSLQDITEAYLQEEDVFIYPTLEGGCCIEYDTDPYLIEIEFRVDGTIFFLAEHSFSEDRWIEEDFVNNEELSNFLESFN